MRTGDYTPGPASGARIDKTDGDKWTLVLVRDLRHAPERVWAALTDPEQIREWAPYDVSGSLGAVGSVQLTWVGTGASVETQITRAEPPNVLECGDMRWELEESGEGTRLTLWHAIDRRCVSMGAAGWHICLDGLDHLLAGTPLGRLVGPEAMKYEGWQRLNKEYAAQFKVDAPSW
jgi:uncharacterized protein YndB with AHSA1/START domain